MTPLRHKEKGQSWPDYMAYVEGRLAESSMSTLQELCRLYGVGIEELAITLAAKRNDVECADIEEVLKET